MENRKLEYDLAISFAGENRCVAEEIAGNLSNKGYKVFYDNYEQAKLLGEDLLPIFSKVYNEISRFCLIIISSFYVEKYWTIVERKFAIERAMTNREAYLIPLRLDDTKLPDVSPTIGYLDIRNTGINDICNLLQIKLGIPFSFLQDIKESPIDELSNFYLHQAFSICYRRALFTRYHAQLNQDAMFQSLSDCRSSLQPITPFIKPEENRLLVAGIIAELDLIERCNQKGFSWEGLGTNGTIDGAKLRIIHALNRLSLNSDIPFSFPKSITEEVFFSKEEADSPPEGNLTPDKCILI